MRFGKLNQIIPSISNKVLAGELKELEQYGLVHRIEFTEMPPRVEYSLTNAGKSLLPLLHELANWGNTQTAKKIIKEFIWFFT